MSNSITRRKFMGMAMGTAVGCVLLPNAMSAYAAYNANNGPQDAAEKAIYDFIDAVNMHDWDKWLLTITPVVRPMYEEFINDEISHVDKVGILSVENAKILSITQAELDDYMLLPELCEASDGPGSYVAYYVELSLDVSKENKYFQNGTHYYLVTVLHENNNWRVGGFSSCPDPISTCADFVAPGTTPASITVKDENGKISTVPLKTFTINVMCNSIGNAGFNTQANFAMAVIVKMDGWYSVRNRNHAAAGFDTKYGMVEYMSYLKTNADCTRAMEHAVNSMWKYRMCAVTDSGEKLFWAAYLGADKASVDRKGDGIFWQNRANYLANTGSYTWTRLLEHFYNNSTYSPSGGHPRYVKQIKISNT